MAAKAGTGKARKGGEGGDGRDLSPEDNLAAVKEAERVQFLSVMSKLRAQRIKVEAAKTALDAERTVLNDIFHTAKSASPRFTRERLNSYLTDAGRKARDLVQEEQIRREHRDWLGLPTGAQQMSLFDSDQTPQAVKDEAFWRAEGYMAYHRGDLCEAPTEIGDPQAWLKGWQDAQTATAFAMKQVEEAV